MQFSRTFIVEDSEPMVHHELGRLLRDAGYTLLPDGQYQRGTREGSMLSFDPAHWHARILADTRITPEYYTRVVLSYDVKTAGQTLKYHIRQFWVDEVNQIVAGLGGRPENGQDPRSQEMGLDLIPPVDQDHQQVDSFETGVQTRLDPVQSLRRSQSERQMKSGANWFFWIAGLSVVNSVIYLLDARLSFIVGLGMTQIVDAFASVFSEELPEGLALFRVLALVINLAIVALFTGFGLLARRGKRWAFMVGMGLYFLDGIIFLWVSDWFAAIFHAIALYGLFRGYLACRELRRIESEELSIGPA
jgi:hypothetical protein